jgi:hypothetical protein
MSKDLFHAALQRAERDAELQRFTIGMQNFNERDAELQRAGCRISTSGMQNCNER